MRKRYFLCILSIVSTQVLGQTVDQTVNPMQPEIRLPSITSRWKRTGDIDAPEISIEEIEKCMGQNMTMQSRIDKAKQQQHRLETEWADLTKANADLERSAVSIQSNRVHLQEELTKFQSEIAALNQQLSAIEKKKRLGPRGQTEVNAINALADAYNKKVVRYNEWRGNLLKEQEALNISIERHNVAVTAVAQRATTYNNQNDEFKSMAASLLNESEKYVADCTGERLIRK